MFSTLVTLAPLTAQVSDSQLATAANLFPDNTPTSKEGYLYRQAHLDFRKRSQIHQT